MRLTFFLLGVAFAGIIQGTLLNNFRFFWVKPDLLLAMAVIAGLSSLRIRWAIFSAFLAGFLKDAIGVYPLGMNVVLFPAWAFLIIKLKRQISIESNHWMPLAILCAVSIANNIAVRLFLFCTGGAIIPAGIFMRTILIESAYTAAVFPFLFRLAGPVIVPSVYKK